LRSGRGSRQATTLRAPEALPEVSPGVHSWVPVRYQPPQSRRDDRTEIGRREDKDRAASLRAGVQRSLTLRKHGMEYDDRDGFDGRIASIRSPLRGLWGARGCRVPPRTRSPGLGPRSPSGTDARVRSLPNRLASARRAAVSMSISHLPPFSFAPRPSPFAPRGEAANIRTRTK
jgi:hypothetical protein